jgi:hypothetical protein
MTTKPNPPLDLSKVSYAGFKEVIALAVQHMNDQWANKNPGCEPTEAEVREIAQSAKDVLEKELPGFLDAFTRAWTIEFINEELSIWEARHPGEGEPSEDERRRIWLAAKARVMAGQQPNLWKM